jgi:hypothetical protein
MNCGGRRLLPRMNKYFNVIFAKVNLLRRFASGLVSFTRLRHKAQTQRCCLFIQIEHLGTRLWFVVLQVSLSLDAVVLSYVKRDRGLLFAAERTNKVRSNLNKKP